MTNHKAPIVIQGGMGAGVSDWRLAQAVSKTGQLGVVSGTAVDVILARRLQAGDEGGHMRRGLNAFPIPGVAQRIIDKYFVDGGKSDDKKFKAKPVGSEKPTRQLEELMVASNFVEVFLAREGHDAPVGINFLEKIQLPTLPSLYGAMLAGVTYVLMGAGIPKEIPGFLDRLSQGEAVELRLDVKGVDSDEKVMTRFDPNTIWANNADTKAPKLNRPDFIAIVSSATLANMLARRSTGKVNGFIIEGPTAGGHNAPPRGRPELSIEGEPVYGDRDVCDLEAINKLGLPYWLAGSYAEPEQVAEALRMGATGVQVGTAFAYCQESGLAAQIKADVLALSRDGEAKIFTDPVASPTGFPFKVVELDGTHSSAESYEERTRICDLGYLRHAYKRDNGKIGWRCPAEPVSDYVRKGGDIADTVGRKCVCNGLMANIALAQINYDNLEKALVTSGDDVQTVARFLKPGATTYKASEVVAYLLQPKPAAAC